MDRKDIVCEGVEWINLAVDYCENLHQVETQNSIDPNSTDMLRLIHYTWNLI
jgi:hypothetical protein